MKVYIIDHNPKMAAQLKSYFKKEKEVEVLCIDFADFMRSHRVEGVVSPANSFGLMDGGYDLAITEWFGDQLQKRVQQHIIEHCCGEQPVGTSFLIDAGKDGQKLIHTPSMRLPGVIRDYLVVYQCTRTSLMTAMENGVKSVVLPVFGGACGKVPYRVAARMMYLGYRQVMEPRKEISWESVNRI